MQARILVLTLILCWNFSTAQTTLKDQYIVTSDLDSLATDIYLPEGKGPFPVILMRTPYSKHQRRYEQLFNAKGYVMIVQDVRGRAKSTGRFRAWIDEELDGVETIEWIIKQKWSNGKIGLLGTSYSGYAAMQLASTNHPAIKVVVNNSGPVDLYNVIFPGGVFHNTAILPWTMAFTENNGFNFPPYKSGLSMDQLAKQMPLNDAFTKNKYTGAFWNYLLNHQTKDGYWRTVNVSDADQFDIPILHITGWFDFISTSAIDGYLKIIEGQKRRTGKNNQKLIIGPWIHDDMMNGNTKVGEVDYGKDVKVGLRNFLDMSITYFDTYLKDSKSSNELPKIKFFEIGSKKWIEVNELPKTKEIVYYLNSDRSLQRKTSSKGKDTFVFDPNNPIETLGGANIHFPFFGDTNGIRTQNQLEKRKDLLVYSSETLKKSLNVFGKIKATLYVSTSAEDADFTVKINQVHSDGTITNLRDGIQRLSFSKSLNYRQFPEPESINKVEVDLGYISALIPKGSKISIHISSSNYPKFSLNPGTKQNALKTSEFSTATQTIYSSSKYKSSIRIPVRK